MGSKLFVSPHNDDETLFGAFTILRERPHVAIVYDSYVQADRGALFCSREKRRGESLSALEHLLTPADRVHFLGLSDRELVEFPVTTALRKIRDELEPSEVWLPAVEEDGNRHHNLVGRIGLQVFAGRKVVRYLTYTPSGKSSSGQRVGWQNAEWIARKLAAMICYTSQLVLESTREHFVRDLYEYYAD